MAYEFILSRLGNSSLPKVHFISFVVLYYFIDMIFKNASTDCDILNTQLNGTFIIVD